MIPTVIEGPEAACQKKKKKKKEKISPLSVFAFNQGHGRWCWKAFRKCCFRTPVTPKKFAPWTQHLFLITFALAETLAESLLVF